MWVLIDSEDDDWWTSLFLLTTSGVFSLGVPVDALFFIGNQLVATSHTGKVGVWNAVTQHWQVSWTKACYSNENISETHADLGTCFVTLEFILFLGWIIQNIEYI